MLHIIILHHIAHEASNLKRILDICYILLFFSSVKSSEQKKKRGKSKFSSNNILELIVRKNVHPINESKKSNGKICLRNWETLKIIQCTIRYIRI